MLKLFGIVKFTQQLAYKMTVCMDNSYSMFTLVNFCVTIVSSHHIINALIFSALRPT